MICGWADLVRGKYGSGQTHNRNGAGDDERTKDPATDERRNAQPANDESEVNTPKRMSQRKPYAKENHGQRELNEELFVGLQ